MKPLLTETQEGIEIGKKKKKWNLQQFDGQIVAI
jgi:hypothetical protein